MEVEEVVYEERLLEGHRFLLLGVGEVLQGRLLVDLVDLDAGCYRHLILAGHHASTFSLHRIHKSNLLFRLLRQPLSRFLRLRVLFREILRFKSLVNRLLVTYLLILVQIVGDILLINGIVWKNLRIILAS